MHRTARLLLLLLLVTLAAPALAQGPPPAVPAAAQAGGGLHEIGQKLNLVDFVSTFLYGLMGIALSMIGYKVYGMIVPFDIHKEIAEDQNVSLGIVLGSIIIGLSMIVAAAIL